MIRGDMPVRAASGANCCLSPALIPGPHVKQIERGFIAKAFERAGGGQVKPAELPSSCTVSQSVAKQADNRWPAGLTRIVSLRRPRRSRRYPLKHVSLYNQ